ncbi:methylamine utilization protein [Colwellia sp. RSH04]|uniref:methylamine utilization protein n=1 Tax=Colwellia sp. RSH04 TaxID=2305464 RepID=UPI000E567E8E|nr:methylamine utilization protein [Colwellia sp. RSH04]RHW75092.1 methylamine utilization protein [Colwellia sp. RSH04]
MSLKIIINGLTSLALLFCLPLLAQTTLTIHNQHNQALKNAVIEIQTQIAAKTAVVTTEPLIMDQVNKSFVPEVLIVPQHSAVAFPNSDDIRHHVYSFSSTKTFELKLYANKPKDPILFDQHGIVVLGCNIHDAMVGYIYVTNNPYTYLTDEKGQVQLPIPATEIEKIDVWHANTTGDINSRQSFSSFATKTELKLQLPTQQPKQRDSFEDVFHHAQ